MAYIYKNINGNTATSLNSRTREDEKYTRVVMCNKHATDAVTVDLYIYRQYKKNWAITGLTGTDPSDAATWGALDYPDPYDQDEASGQYANGSFTDPGMSEEIYYIIKGISIPQGESLALDQYALAFNSEKYSMYIKLNEADGTVDVMASKEKKTSYEIDALIYE